MYWRQEDLQQHRQEDFSTNPNPYWHSAPEPRCDFYQQLCLSTVCVLMFIVAGRPSVELLLQVASRDCKYISEQKSALELFGTARKLEKVDWGAQSVCSMVNEAETNSYEDSYRHYVLETILNEVRVLWIIDSGVLVNQHGRFLLIQSRVKLWILLGQQKFPSERHNEEARKNNLLAAE